MVDLKRCGAEIAPELISSESRCEISASQNAVSVLRVSGKESQLGKHAQSIVHTGIPIWSAILVILHHLALYGPCSVIAPLL